MTVGKRIAMAREALGLTKGKFAKKMNISYQDRSGGLFYVRNYRF